ncbi:uncharacterized protein TrAtP1_003645 [Trichoderma atroviride]|uniref:uncharacterized protein n=1 Tax=Hypocrea atroviridis TaxID=63577 RepID=UPI00333318B6|nr:hypothetical protein TrAtP1_003645 [Trichoderma atroviride]
MSEGLAQDAMRLMGITSHSKIKESESRRRGFVGETENDSKVREAGWISARQLDGAVIKKEKSPARAWGQV